MSWKPEVEEIERRRALARQHGGEEAVAKHHSRGRLTVRERIDALLDAGSFREYGSVTGHAEPAVEGQAPDFTPANLVMGVGKLDGRLVVVGGDDFTLRGAAYSPAGMKKGQYVDELAIKRRLPMVRLLEAGGASVAGAYGTKGRSGYDMTTTSPANLLALDALATVPNVCAALGPVAGYPAARLVASHLSIMATETAQVLTGGPVVVERAIGEKLTKEELGGAKIHLRSGVVDNGAKDEEDVWRQIRAFLSYLPSNAWELPPVVSCDDPPDREEEELLSILPRNRRRAYKMRRIIELVVDLGSFFEMTPLYGRSQITGLARVAGHSVGVIANDPVHQGGSMTAHGAQKLRRFVETCDTFHLPIVSFVDEPGFMIGLEAEKAGTIRYGMEAMFAVLQTRVPWAALILRKAFGVAAGIHLGPNATAVAWPSAEAGALPLESGVALAYGREIEAAADPDARRRELEDELAAAQSAFPRGEEFGFHDMIDPRQTRAFLCGWVEEVQTQLRGQLGPARYTRRP